MAGVNLQKLNPDIGSEGDKEQWKDTHKAVVDRCAEVQSKAVLASNASNACSFTCQMKSRALTLNF